MSEILAEFESDLIHNESFEEIEREKNVIPAEILSESRVLIEPKEEQLNERLTELLKNLPQEAETKFIVTRLADKNLAGQFRIPCNHNEECDAIYWNGDNEPSELYAQVRKLHGGGLYRFRTHANGGFVKNGTWTQIIADGEISEKEKVLESLKTKTEAVKAEVVQPQFVPQQQNVDDSFERFLMQFERLEKFKQVIAPPTPPPMEQTAPTVNKETIKMALIEKAMNEPELVSMAIRSVFDIPADVAAEAEEKNTVIEIIKYVAAHPNEAKTVLDVGLGSLGNIFSPFASLLAPKAPPQPVTLDSFRQPRNDSQPVSPPKTPPQPTQPPKIEALQVDEVIPHIELGE